MFKRKQQTRPETLHVTRDGLVRLVADLVDAEEFGLVTFPDLLNHGYPIRVRPRWGDSGWDTDTMVVFLSSYQTELLLNRLPRRTLQDEYGGRE